MGAKKGAWILLALVCLTAVGGHLLARHALGDCTRDTVNEMIMRGVTGQNPDGTLVRADKIPVTARVAMLDGAKIKRHGVVHVDHEGHGNSGGYGNLVCPY